MPRGVYNRSKSTAAPKAATTAMTVTNVAPLSFNESKWFTKLEAAEQKIVQSEGLQLAKALINHGVSKIAVGEHLSKLQAVLEPHNVFGQFLKQFHFSKRTAYRYIAGYQNAKARLPEAVLKAAMARGFNIIGDSEVRPLGIYTQAAALLPPPQTADESQANTYLDQLEDVRKKNRGTATGSTITMTVPVPQDPDTLLKECFRFVHTRYKRLPNNSKTKSNWVRSLCGMILADLGVSNVQSISPMAIPEEFKAQRGRPRQSEALQATA